MVMVSFVLRNTEASGVGRARRRTQIGHLLSTGQTKKMILLLLGRGFTGVPLDNRDWTAWPIASSTFAASVMREILHQ